ncbi:MAG: F0F1 ATP synthase subunit alpha [Erysipelotrichaceae bacterium]|nr:F0F1 ATP synthase subunit alpha [Erysipelotrichaceae bacterium]
MEIKANEISALIKEQIKKYQNKVELLDTGTVISVGDGVAMVHGLKNAMLSELVEFNNDVFGMILSLDEDSVGVVIFGDDSTIKEDDIVTRTKRVVEIPVGDDFLGRVVNPLGQPIDNLGPINSIKTRPIERIAPGVITRQSVDTPLQTGIKAIDSMIPIGRGQRELIIGDRQTGKTAIAIDTIINQKNENVNCVYVAIGQKASTVAQVVEKLRVHGALSYTTIVAATASEMAPMQYIAPYSGVTLAEEWMEQGKDVLIVYDDLSKHAVAYRTLSLLLRRSPGREAYPGDVFYLHSRLLERAAKLSKEYGGGSITALPIIETQAGDISAYIPTNVISITDGQIFLQSDLFAAGQRPAIDTGLSVSRVGSAAQIKAIKQVSGTIKIELANYRELQAFAQFGSDLDKTTKDVLDHGAKVYELLKQNQYESMDVYDQVIQLFTAKHRFIKKIELDKIQDYEKSLISYMHTNHQDLIDDMKENKKITVDTENKLKEIINKFTNDYIE